MIDVEVPENVTAMYIDLASIIGSARITDGNHDNSDLVRTATISQKHKTMTLTFKKYVPMLFCFLFFSNIELFSILSYSQIQV